MNKQVLKWFLGELKVLNDDVYSLAESTTKPVKDAILEMASQVLKISVQANRDRTYTKNLTAVEGRKIIMFYYAGAGNLASGKCILHSSKFWDVDSSEFPTANSQLVTNYCATDLPFQNHMLDRAKPRWIEESKEALRRIDEEMCDPTEQRFYDLFYGTQASKRSVLVEMIQLVHQGKRHDAVVLGVEHKTI